ncbi:MAG: TIGR01459 family HAD-type hydrolase [Geminicoccaceae bacterium]
MTTPVFADGIGAFADRYEAFVIDQWGVLHDGIRPYPGVVEALERLHDARKRIVLLSNSGRRKTVSEKRLLDIGFDLRLFDAVVTSGETAWQGFRERIEPPFTTLGRRCMLLTREGDLSVAQGIGLDLVATPEDADFLFVSGVEPPPMTADDYQETLDRSLACGLPMLCANPDLVAVTGADLTLAPGTLAERYKAAGGTVHYVGKPYAPVYRACRHVLPDLQPAQIIGIGDSMAHDVRGANDAGMASAFVTQGIHQEAFPPEAPVTDLARALHALAAEHAARPDWVIPRLAW